MSRSTIPRAVRRQVVRRAGSRCEYCYLPDSHSNSPFAIEHIQPATAGGSDEPENLAYSCQNCNGSKGARQTATDPQDGEEVPLFHPRQQNWDEHFNWSEDFLFLIGQTATGRATVAALQINREPAANLRRILRDAGLHP